jgi:hypothetical protein
MEVIPDGKADPGSCDEQSTVIPGPRSGARNP